MRPLKTKVSVTLDTEVIEIMKELAEQDDRSFSQYINLVLKDYLKNKNISKDGEICYHVDRHDTAPSKASVHREARSM